MPLIFILLCSISSTDGEFERTVFEDPSEPWEAPPDRGTSSVNRDDFALRLPRSAPDALRYEPGVFVQQTAHGQGSALIRGLTGQQTLLMFDGIRLNNSTYRQGPNQYFFTLDSQTIDRIDVIRGGASTIYGSDALGGALLAKPIEPTWNTKNKITPKILMRAATADVEYGGRAQIDATWNDRIGFVGGIGGRNLGLLQSGGNLTQPAMVPRFGSDGRTQLGTGFGELTADGRLVFRANSTHKITAAAYLYRQSDAPRTDQCPAAYAPYNECLKYNEQLRALSYVRWTSTPKWRGLHTSTSTLSWQRQTERRSLDQPLAYVQNNGHDLVDVLGFSWWGNTDTLDLTPTLHAGATFGAEHESEWLTSDASITFTDISVTRGLSRGQYVSGSTYQHGGVFIDPWIRWNNRITLRGGSRVGWASAKSPGDTLSGSDSIDHTWLPLAGHAGLTWDVASWISLLAHFDHAYRAPNLNDLTARQQTGPGFQFENSALKPETADTYEVGFRIKHRFIQTDLWGYHTRLKNAVIKALRNISECPADTPQCNASWSRVQLTNADGVSIIWGTEGVITLFLPWYFSIRSTLSYALGKDSHEIPLSRIPPFNGTGELTWKHPQGFTAGGAVRWATSQTRLAPVDQVDARIPLGGTPGFVVADLRMSYRTRRAITVSLVFENILNAAYRYQGSSINGPGRGLMFLAEIGPFWR